MSYISNQDNPFQSNIPIQFGDSGNLDAFGRLRTSSTHTLFDTQLQYDIGPLLIDSSIRGTASRTHLPNESTAQIGVGTASGDRIKSQTKEYFRYIPGKSFLVIMSRVLGRPKLNTRKRTGYFDDHNGLFFEVDSTELSVVQRSYASGSVEDYKIPQKSWNIDKLDGTGPSGIKIDLNKGNIFIIDFEWLGVGRVRYGIYGPNGLPVYCHAIENANANTTVYMTTPNLPVRLEVENTGATTSPTTVKLICTSVIVEDGSEPSAAVPHSASNGNTPISVTTRRNVLTIRPRTTFTNIINRATINNIVMEIMSDKSIYWEAVYNGTLGGTPVFNTVDASFSTIEYDVAGTTVTGGIVIASGYGAGADKSSSKTGAFLNSRLPFGLGIDANKPTNISLVVTSLDGTATVYSTMDWKEIY